MFPSNNQKSSVAIFIGKPFPTPDRLFFRAAGISGVRAELIKRLPKRQLHSDGC
jgi:hypothetical protein